MASQPMEFRSINRKVLMSRSCSRDSGALRDLIVERSSPERCQSSFLLFVFRDTEKISLTHAHGDTQF